MVSGNQAKKKSWHERKGKQSQFTAIICSWTLAPLDSDVVGLHSCLCSSPPTEAIISQPTLRIFHLISAAAFLAHVGKVVLPPEKDSHRHVDPGAALTPSAACAAASDPLALIAELSGVDIDMSAGHSACAGASVAVSAVSATASFGDTIAALTLVAVAFTSKVECTALTLDAFAFVRGPAGGDLPSLAVRSDVLTVGEVCVLLQLFLD
jgi:hypothetical protein